MDTMMTTWLWNLKKMKNMADDNRNKWITVQGADPPVPVGEGGERTGPPRPSSDDCPAPPVANQAEAQVQATGEVGRDPFKRSHRIFRSPMRAARSFSVGDMDWRKGTPPTTDDVVLVDAAVEPGSAYKRKCREEDLDSGPSVIEELIVETIREIKNLQRLVTDNTNTHKKIKETSRKLTRLSEKIEREDISLQINKKLATQKGCDTREVGCQTHIEIQKTDARHATEGDIANINNYRDFLDQAKKEWPEQAFKCAFMVKGSPLRANEDADLLVLIEEATGKNRNEGIRKAFEDRYPELSQMEGSMSHLTVSSTYIDGNGHRIAKDRVVTRAVVEGNQEGWFDILKRLSEIAKSGSRKKIALYPPGQDKDGNLSRKMAECIFRDSGIKCLIYTKESGSEEDTKRQRSDRGGPREGRRTDAIIINKQQGTYADLLRTVKDTIKAGTNAAKSIKTIRKTRNDEILIVVDKESTESTAELREEIGKKFGDAVKYSKSRSNQLSLVIKDIDAITTEDEVAEAVNRELGSTEPCFKIGTLRPYFGGNQAITLRIEEERARELLTKTKGKIRIGLSLCQLTERIEVGRCYRCWGYGHKRHECTEEADRSEACRNCGENGHEEKTCQKDPYCLSCGRVGHKAGAGICPEFRKALSRTRLLRKKKKAY